MLRAEGVMVLSHYLLLLFLLALQAQNAQSAAIPGQGAGKDYEKVPEEFPEGSLEVPEDEALDKAPSEMDSDTVLETFPIEESGSVPGSDKEIQPIQVISPLAEHEKFSGSATGQKTDTAGHCDPNKYYILGTVAASALLLLGAVCGYIVMYQLLKRDRRTREDKEAPGKVYRESSWERHGQPGSKGEAKSGEGPGNDERAQANRFSCRLFPEVFAAELAQLYKNMGTDPSPLPTCPSCDLAGSASSRDHWISLDSPQPTPSWCPCYQYQQEYFILEDNDYFSDSK